MRETKLYSRMRGPLSKMGEIERVENVIGSGVPDIYYTIEGVAGWIETKIAKSGVVYFERYQPGWYRRHIAQGLKHVFVAVLNEDRLYIFHASEVTLAPRFVKGKWIAINLDDMIPTLVLFGNRYNWDSLRQVLIS